MVKYGAHREEEQPATFKGSKSWDQNKIKVKTRDQNMDLTGKKSDPPPPWDQNHGIKKTKKNRVSKYGSHREEEPATTFMGSN